MNILKFVSGFFVSIRMVYWREKYCLAYNIFSLFQRRSVLSCLIRHVQGITFGTFWHKKSHKRRPHVVAMVHELTLLYSRITYLFIVQMKRNQIKIHSFSLQGAKGNLCKKPILNFFLWTRSSISQTQKKNIDWIQGNNF